MTIKRNRPALGRSAGKAGRGRPRRERMFAVLPTLLTLGNAVCGFGAITVASQVDRALPGGGVRDKAESLFVAGVLIFIAMVFDMLDGRAARWARQSSQFGAELDSLCDAISFGVAPAVLLITFAPAHLHPRLLWMIAVLYVVAAILRLARFNVETDDDDSHTAFSGLPSPAAAGLVASFLVAYPQLTQLARPAAGMSDWQLFVQGVAVRLIPAVPWALPFTTFLAAALMVSRIRYPHLFNQMFRGKKSYRHLVTLLAGLGVVFLVQELAVPLVFIAFAASGPARALTGVLSGRRPEITPQPLVPDRPSDSEQSPPAA